MLPPKWNRGIIGLGILLLVFLGLATAGVVMLGLPQSLQKHARYREQLKSGDHRLLLRAAIELASNPQSHVLFAGTNLSALPQHIRALSPSWVNVEAEQVTIELHGGFDHFGFLARSNSSGWELEAYTEAGRETLLSEPVSSPH